MGSRQAAPLLPAPGCSAERALLCQLGAADLVPSGGAHATGAGGGGIQHSGEWEGPGGGRDVTVGVAW